MHISVDFLSPACSRRRLRRQCERDFRTSV